MARLLAMVEVVVKLSLTCDDVGDHVVGCEAAAFHGPHKL